jgi:hypothetical protein
MLRLEIVTLLIFIELARFLNADLLRLEMTLELQRRAGEYADG